MAALQLVRHGVSVRLIDRLLRPAVTSRALGVQARTLEIYAELGLAEPALALGQRATAANLWSAGRQAARVPLGDIGQGLSAFPFMLVLSQDENERLLRETLAGYGVEVAWGVELLGLAQHDSGVEASVRDATGGVRAWRANWVLGCDGARSQVREACGIAFPGAPYEQVFFLADTIATGPMRAGELNVFLRPGGFHMLFPLRGPDRWRVIGILPATLREHAALGFDDVVPHVRAEVGAELEFHACHWFSTYRIHHRVASRFRAGRCFLLGDAAHVHSPVGAQGMNTGLQDAYNLAWKLAWVMQHGADDRLLDSYATEREPVAARLLATTDRLFTAIVSPRAWAGLLRSQVLSRLVATAMRGRRMRELAFRTVSQIGIRYRRSSLSWTLPEYRSPILAAGDRFPWPFDPAAPGTIARRDGRRFALVAVGQTSHGELPACLAARCDRVELAAADLPPGAPARAFYLVRPDGHIGLCGATLDVDAIAAYTSTRLGLRSACERVQEQASLA
jgi:2-polyprenyl-6-methoxyphenol hydroxylase-like FAD-dependent oxidoreductase